IEAPSRRRTASRRCSTGSAVAGLARLQWKDGPRETYLDATSSRASALPALRNVEGVREDRHGIREIALRRHRCRDAVATGLVHADLVDAFPWSQLHRAGSRRRDAHEILNATGPLAVHECLNEQQRPASAPRNERRVGTTVVNVNRYGVTEWAVPT